MCIRDRGQHDGYLILVWLLQPVLCPPKPDRYKVGLYGMTARVLVSIHRTARNDRGDATLFPPTRVIPNARIDHGTRPFAALAPPSFMLWRPFVMLADQRRAPAPGHQ